MLGLIVDLQSRYFITSNRESGFGRYDVILEPKKPNEDDGKKNEWKPSVFGLGAQAFSLPKSDSGEEVRGDAKIVEEIKDVESYGTNYKIDSGNFISFR